MAELRNSKRSMDRATYTQIQQGATAELSPRRGRGTAWGKWSYFSALAATPDELDQVAARTSDADDVDALAVLRSMVAEDPAPVPFTASGRFASVPADLLLHIGTELRRLRGGEAAQVLGNLNFAFEQSLAVEPVGYLHLERLNFVPAGIERGELTYSVPLSPAEEVNIAHKEWAHTSEEFERIVTDYIENYSEQGVSEKTDLAEATSSQSQHSFGFSLSASATGGYGPVSVTTSTGFNIAEASSRSQQTSRNHSSELTKKASRRSKQEHKTSFKVASASGTEDQAVRKIKNPFDNKAVRVDYYQLVRKWKVELYRYGLRLTYDITIPEPGSDIISKILEIRTLEDALAQPFEFPLQLNEIDRDTWDEKAAEWGAAVEPPPEAEIQVFESYTRKWEDEAAAERLEYTKIEIVVPEDFRIYDVDYSTDHGHWTDFSFYAPQNLDSWIGASGRLNFLVGTKRVSVFMVQIRLYCKLDQELYEGWRLSAWNAMRQAAQQRHEENRSLIKARIARLEEELGGQDPLSLRQLEREEVMKGVLRWLFGPTFVFRHGEKDLYWPTTQAVKEGVVQEVRAEMETVKFLHHAIEWENMLYFLYPYFWSHTEHWDARKRLDHPNLLHRMFLRSGAARVVLTIRPGFEAAFVSLIDGGDPGEESPYLTVAEEMQSFAQTNYPGIRAANPVEGARPLLTPRQRKAWSDMEGIIALLENYKTAHGQYPTTAQGLKVLGGNMPVSPWGNPYSYVSPGLANDYELTCLGADNAKGGEGEDADITSWAEASLIGEWFEYTPTSALDIAFNETLPSA